MNCIKCCYPSLQKVIRGSRRLKDLPEVSDGLARPSCRTAEPWPLSLPLCSGARPGPPLAHYLWLAGLLPPPPPCSCIVVTTKQSYSCIERTLTESLPCARYSVSGEESKVRRNPSLRGAYGLMSCFQDCFCNRRSMLCYCVHSSSPQSYCSHGLAGGYVV